MDKHYTIPSKRNKIFYAKTGNLLTKMSSNMAVQIYPDFI